MALERVPNEVMLELDRRDREATIRRRKAEESRNRAAEFVALITMDVFSFLHETMRNETTDIQSRLRAAEILASRQLPKIAAKHAEIAENETIDSVDVKAIRDSILEQFKMKRK